MKFDVKITQILEGHVEVEAADFAAAVELADERFNKNGEALPDMDDTSPLRFSASPTRDYSEPLGTIGSEEIKEYLIHNGIPRPSRDQIDEFLCGGENQSMYDEAVRNGYALCDVDRWFHLKELIDEPISFRAAMMIDDALWEEEYETLEINKISDILSTPEGICKKRIEDLIDSFNRVGAFIPNGWGVTPDDLVTLSKKLNIPLTVSQEQKPSLSSLIASADSKQAAPPPDKESPSPGIEPLR